MPHVNFTLPDRLLSAFGPVKNLGLPELTTILNLQPSTFHPGRRLQPPSESTLQIRTWLPLLHATCIAVRPHRFIGERVRQYSALLPLVTYLVKDSDAEPPRELSLLSLSEICSSFVYQLGKNDGGEYTCMEARPRRTDWQVKYLCPTRGSSVFSPFGRAKKGKCKII